MTQTEIKMINMLIDKNTERRSAGQLGEYEIKQISEIGIRNLKRDIAEMFGQEESQ